ncbi:hypothetical protein KUTeg_004101 [Tegillarca granosa]|uniref:Uncharacterized protein n=1 Tax=Tegillarca granosa TaxID=220873 RepID=A0ABQ9FP30_TEGGR|nr:hypothetical protein KUTeg_004101 [Tegillarca granosa]
MLMKKNTIFVLIHSLLAWNTAYNLRYSWILKKIYNLINSSASVFTSINFDPDLKAVTFINKCIYLYYTCKQKSFRNLNHYSFDRQNIHFLLKNHQNKVYNLIIKTAINYLIN